jgi:hypothetical protein
VDIALQADLEQWLVHDGQILLSTECAWNKEGVAWSQRWLPYHLPEGCSGVKRRARIETEQEQSNPGEFPKTLMPCASVHWYHACTWTRTYNSLDLSCSTVSLWDLSCFKIRTRTHAFLSFFSHCTTLECSIILFLFTNFIIYIELWHVPNFQK